MSQEADMAEAWDAIAECAQSGSSTLDLSHKRLTELPPEVARLTAVTTLDLTGNQLTALPPEIGALTHLTTLDLASNELTALPPEIGTLTSLTTLNLGENKLTALPPEIAALTKLTTLDLTENRLVVLPTELEALTNLTVLGLTNTGLITLPPSIGALTALEVLYLGYNGLVAIPPEIANLTALKHLYLHNNQLTALPPEIVALTALTDLTLGDNQFAGAPPEIAAFTALRRLELCSSQITALPPEITALTSLASLELSNNQLTALPPEIAGLKALRTLELNSNELAALPPEIEALTALTTVDLRDNQLTALPPESARLTALEELKLEGNPLPASYFDALEQGLGSLRTLLESLSETTQPLFEAKLLMTGEGQVGKSWTLAKLQGQEPLKEIGNDNTTWGIDRGELKLPHPSLDGAEILLNTWDFGGQKIYRVTHQFFFSEQAIYILVWNPRQGAESCRVREWLRMIALRTGSNAPVSAALDDAPKPRAKVIMVATHAQSEGGAYNPDYGRSNLDGDLQSMIVDEIAIDSITGHNIDALRAMIARHAATLPDMGQPFNTRWAAAREAVLALREGEPWIDFRKFTRVCGAHDVTDREQLRTLAWTYLHSLGRAIWYGSVSKDDAELDDPLLADTIVLDAVWLSRAFVQVLDDERTQKAGGMLDHRRFPEIWTDHGRAGWHRYTPNEYEILKLVMRRFDVALPTRESQGKRSLVPQLVPYQRPKLPWAQAAEAPGARTIRLTCELGYEATGLMARLIAATEPWHVYDGGVGLFWEEGAFLEETASFDNQALMTVQGTERPSVHVVVSGDQPAFLMNELYRILESVLGFWKGMTKDYFISCPTLRNGEYCSGQFKHEAVLRRINDKIDRAFDCQHCDSLWTAEQLILGFEALEPSDSYILNHLYRRDQIPCPRMFLLESADINLLQITSWAGFVGERFKLTLLSELSGQKIASKEFSFTKEWVKWVAPVTRIASLALAGAALPISGDLAAKFKEGAAFLDKLGALPENGGTLPAIDPEPDAKSIRLPKQHLVKFAKFLAAIGLDPREHGMDLAQAADRRWLWMSAQEVELYTPQEAAKQQ